MTAEDASEGHPSAAQRTVALDGLHGIFGTGRHIAASWGQQGRDGPLVGPQQLHRDEFGYVSQELLSAFGFRPPGFGLRLFSSWMFLSVSSLTKFATAFVRLRRRLGSLRSVLRRSRWS